MFLKIDHVGRIEQAQPGLDAVRPGAISKFDQNARFEVISANLFFENLITDLASGAVSVAQIPVLKFDGVDSRLRCGVDADRESPVGDVLPAGALALGIHRADGSYVDRPAADAPLAAGDRLYFYGPDAAG